MTATNHLGDIYTIPGFWDEAMCRTCIEATEASGYFPDTVETDNAKDNTESRTNYRVIFTSSELADGIWQGLNEVALPAIAGFTPYGINPSFRFYKYLPGQSFNRHIDRGIEISDDEKSCCSLLIYLNDGFSGGETVFDSIALQPATGTAVIFPHKLEHAGAEVTNGVKYILRTDVIYRR
jgi:prolyl 4-hydroxylase